MTTEQIRQIACTGAFPGGSPGAVVVETHISWVILGAEQVIKIKKPVRFPFLDFSTLPLRHRFCQEEVRLNRRLVPAMYQEVVPVKWHRGHFFIGHDAGEVLDYAVQMVRMDNNLELDRLLKDGKVGAQDMASLAHVLAHFHLENRLVHAVEHPKTDFHDFAGLFELQTVAEKWLGAGVAHQFEALQQHAEQFFTVHRVRLRARAREGYFVEGHGDLHTRNIFMTTPPAVFDCIEFNPHFRRLDVLSDLAFLCMDLAFFGRRDLADAFMAAYLEEWPCMPEPEDKALFAYFKAYRANVRLKITLLELEQHPDDILLQAAQRYWEMLKTWAG